LFFKRNFKEEVDNNFLDFPLGKRGESVGFLKYQVFPSQGNSWILHKTYKVKLNQGLRRHTLNYQTRNKSKA